MAKKVKAEIEYDIDQPRRIKWLSQEKHFCDFKPDVLNMYVCTYNYDEIDFEFTSKNLEFYSLPVDGEDNEFDIWYCGTIEFEVREDQYEVMKKSDFRVGYFIDLINKDGDLAEDEVDYLEILSYNIYLSVESEHG